MVRALFVRFGLVETYFPISFHFFALDLRFLRLTVIHICYSIRLSIIKLV